MKTQSPISTYLFAILAITLASSCGDDDNNPDPNVNTDVCILTNGFLKWTMQSTQFCADKSVSGDQSVELNIWGETESGMTLSLELDSVEPGTYIIDDNTNFLHLTDVLGAEWQSTASSPGTLVITKNDKSANTIEGTFSVDAKYILTGTVLQISNGSFRIKYTE